MPTSGSVITTISGIAKLIRYNGFVLAPGNFVIPIPYIFYDSNGIVSEYASLYCNYPTGDVYVQSKGYIGNQFALVLEYTK